MVAENGESVKKYNIESETIEEDDLFELDEQIK